MEELPLPPIKTSHGAEESLGKRLHSDMLLGEPPKSDTELNKYHQCSTEAPAGKRRRTVRFDSSEPRVAHFERSDKALWYSKKDLTAMKATAKQYSRQINLDSTLGSVYGMPWEKSDDRALPGLATKLRCETFENQRGLERWSSQMLMLSRCITIVNARTVLHLEQSSQTLKGTKDPERLANLYKEASTQAGAFARLLGVADAQSALDETAS